MFRQWFVHNISENHGEGAIEHLAEGVLPQCKCLQIHIYHILREVIIAFREIMLVNNWWADGWDMGVWVMNERTMKYYNKQECIHTHIQTTHTGWQVSKESSTVVKHYVRMSFCISLFWHKPNWGASLRAGAGTGDSLDEIHHPWLFLPSIWFVPCTVVLRRGEVM